MVKELHFCDWNVVPGQTKNLDPGTSSVWLNHILQNGSCRVISHNTVYTCNRQPCDSVNSQNLI